jgi:hypothetical protein
MLFLFYFHFFTQNDRIVVFSLARLLYQTSPPTKDKGSRNRSSTHPLLHMCPPSMSVIFDRLRCLWGSATRSSTCSLHLCRLSLIDLDAYRIRHLLLHMCPLSMSVVLDKLRCLRDSLGLNTNWVLMNIRT